ncbi:hypothetical protein Bbelb_316890 [Branchiostoma belcheri]|nr:hypothetical protein Bbelb_316890 [Branchiostoma belcheri]
MEEEIGQKVRSKEAGDKPRLTLFPEDKTDSRHGTIVLNGVINKWTEAGFCAAALRLRALNPGVPQKVITDVLSLFKKVLNNCQIPNALPGTCRQAVAEHSFRPMGIPIVKHPELTHFDEPLRDGRLASFQKSLQDQRQKWERDHPDAELPVAFYYRIASIPSPYKSQSLTWNRFFKRSGRIEACIQSTSLLGPMSAAIDYNAQRDRAVWESRDGQINFPYDRPAVGHAVAWLWRFLICDASKLVVPICKSKRDIVKVWGTDVFEPAAYPVDDNNVALVYWGRQELDTLLDHYAEQKVTREGNVCEGYVDKYICEEQFVSFKQAVAVRFKGEQRVNEDGEATFHFYRPTGLLQKMSGSVNTDNQWIFGEVFKLMCCCLIVLVCYADAERRILSEQDQDKNTRSLPLSS